jgi:hypothetical protein
VTLAAVASVLALATLLAGFLPLRASSIDPLRALR